jgi:hypothetical protein
MPEMKTLTINDITYDIVDANAIHTPDSAIVGQTIIVKSIDENKKLSEWEAVDFPKVPTKLSELYNDSGYALTADIPIVPDSIITPDTATVGQTIAVKTVDENGKPVEWETVDFPKFNGEITGGVLDTKGIIDVFELPNEDINKSAIYRLMQADFVVDNIIASTTGVDWKCHCVEALPEIGDACTDAAMSFIVTYYNISDNEVYGYVNSEIGSSLGIPEGWYQVGMLFAAVDVEYKGVIRDISEDPKDGGLRVLLSYNYFTYKDEWTKLVAAYEKSPLFDIRWDGDMSDKFTLDMSLVGYAQGVYFTKVNDAVPSVEQVVNSNIAVRTSSVEILPVFEEDIDTNTFPGAFVIRNVIVVVHSSDELSAALGLPSGTLTNGTYFMYNEVDAAPDLLYVSRLVTPARVVKIDKKFLPDIDVDVDSLGLHTVATSGNYADLWNRPTVHTDVVRYCNGQGLNYNQKVYARNNIDVYSRSEVDNKINNINVNVDLSEYAKTTDVETMIANYAKTTDVETMIANYAKTTDVETMIAEAISGAIGGSY